MANQNYLKNRSTAILYRQQINACWRDLVADENSTRTLIESDLVYATYHFLSTETTDILAKALQTAKKCRFIFKEAISGDEDLYSPEYNAHLRLSIIFSEDKSKVQIRCCVSDNNLGNTYYIKSQGGFTPKKYLGYKKLICKLENEY